VAAVGAGALVAEALHVVVPPKDEAELAHFAGVTVPATLAIAAPHAVVVHDAELAVGVADGAVGTAPIETATVLENLAKLALDGRFSFSFPLTFGAALV
jgi:hypothetical protein